MSLTDKMLEDLLVVQFARRYGTSDLTAAAQGLERSPLLPIEAKTKTPAEMQAQLKRICGGDGSGLASELDALYNKLRRRTMDELIKAIREQEALAEHIKQQGPVNTVHAPVTEEKPPAAQKEKSIATPAEEERPVTSAETIDEPMRDAEEPTTVDEVMQDAADEETETDVRPSRESTHALAEDIKASVDKLALKEVQEAAIAEKAAEEVATAKEKEQTARNPTQQDVPAVPAEESTDDLSEPELEEELKAEEPEAEPVQQEEQEEQEAIKPEAQDAIRVEQQAVSTRGRRKRSDTMNTAASTDTAAAAAATATSASATPTNKRNRRRTTMPPVVVSDATANMTEAQLVNFKKFQSTVLPVLANISSHKYASVFAQAVSDKDAPNYSKVVHQPTDLRLIKAQIKAGQIADINGFHKAVLRMLSNAVIYNQDGSEVSKMAKELAEHCESVIAMYRSAELEPEVVEETRTPKRRRKM
jgi:hypothetical protein